MYDTYHQQRVSLTMVERKGGLLEAREADVCRLRQEFQELALAEPYLEHLIRAWRLYVDWEERLPLGSSLGALNYRRMVETVAKGDRVYNPVSRFAILTGFRVRTIGFDGRVRVGSLLDGLEEVEDVGRARAFCEKMIEFFQNPRPFIDTTEEV